MMLDKRKLSAIGLAVALAMFAAGCKKKTAPPPPPPPPAATTAPAPAEPPPAPVIAQFTAEPSTIQSGESSTLRWEVSGNVATVSINNGVGAVQNTGSRRVSPTSSTSYTLTASGPGGNVTASATVNVSSTPPPPPPAQAAGSQGGSLQQRIDSDLRDVYFDYDKSDIRGEAQGVLSQDATALKAILTDFPNASIAVEGHCDERGSAEYNMGLGDRRATSAKEYLLGLGAPADRLKTISYGKERPQCTEASESCWQKNRRVHFSPGQ